MQTVRSWWSKPTIKLLLLILLVRIGYLLTAWFQLRRGGSLFRTDILTFRVIDSGDILGEYYLFASWCVKYDKIPYLDVPLDYPQLAAYLFLLLYFLVPSDQLRQLVYVISFGILQFPLEVATSLLLFKIVRDLIGGRSAFLISIAYNLSPIVLYTWVSRFDCIPIFFTVLALYVFLKGRYSLAFLALGIGTMFKWFPVLLFLPFLISLKKRGISLAGITKSSFAMLGFIAVTTVPFFASSPFAFLASYIYHLGRRWNFESLWTFVAMAVYGTLPHERAPYEPLSTISLALQIIACLMVFLLPCKTNRQLIKCSAYVLIAFVFLVKFFSPQFIAWVSPFLLMRTRRNVDWGIYGGMHGSTYLEYPIFWGLRYSLTPPYFYIAVMARLIFTILALVATLFSLKNDYSTSSLKKNN
ncbi:MAG: hypothetical protein QXW18_00090 [Candidatus Bathyarchaeia archaeon]